MLKQLLASHFYPSNLRHPQANLVNRNAKESTLSLPTERSFATTTGLHIADTLYHLFPEEFDLEKVNTLLGNPELLNLIQKGQLNQVLQAIENDRIRFRNDASPSCYTLNQNQPLRTYLKFVSSDRMFHDRAHCTMQILALILLPITLAIHAMAEIPPVFT